MHDDPNLPSVLAEIVGSPHVLLAPADKARYEEDWRGRYRGLARAVVRPGWCESPPRAGSGLL